MAEPSSSLFHLPLAELCHKCGEHIVLFRQHKNYEPGFCFEVARRALEAHQSEAGECFYTCFSPLVKSWIRRNSAFRGTENDLADLGQASFLQLLEQFRSGRKQWADFHSLSGLLKYFSLCVNSCVITHLRKNKTHLSLDDDELELLPDKPLAPNVRELWSAIEARLKSEQERLAFYERYFYDLSPKEIARRHPQHFSGALDVSRVIANVLARLKRDQDFWARFKDWFDAE